MTGPELGKSGRRLSQLVTYLNGHWQDGKWTSPACGQSGRNRILAQVVGHLNSIVSILYALPFPI